MPKGRERWITKKRRSVSRHSSSTTQLDQGDRASHLSMLGATMQLDHHVEPSSHAAYTRESMEDSISSFFSNPWGTCSIHSCIYHLHFFLAFCCFLNLLSKFLLHKGLCNLSLGGRVKMCLICSLCCFLCSYFYFVHIWVYMHLWHRKTKKKFEKFRKTWKNRVFM